MIAIIDVNIIYLRILALILFSIFQYSTKFVVEPNVKAAPFLKSGGSQGCS